MSNITKVIASVQQMHGGEREQRAKYATFIAWQVAEYEKKHGLDPSPVLKTEEK